MPKPFNTMPLFNPPIDTRRAAKKAIEPKIPSLKDRVLGFLRACGEHGATDQEIAIQFAGSENTYRPRRNELTADGLVYDSGKRRRTGTGKLATVWRAK